MNKFSKIIATTAVAVISPSVLNMIFDWQMSGVNKLGLVAVYFGVLIYILSQDTVRELTDKEIIETVLEKVGLREEM